MFAGILWAIIAGLMLGLYALPNKFTRDFREENTWGLFFMLTMFAVPVVATLAIMKGVGAVYAAPEVRAVLPRMILSSVLWGVGVMMWGKAIHHIGVSLGFSLFIGTVILVGSLLPFMVDHLPASEALAAISCGLVSVLFGVVSNGRAGMARAREEKTAGSAGADGGKSMAAGITIAVVGGLLATGFSFANAVGRPPLHAASQAQGNAEWVTALAVMFPIFLSGGAVMAGYFAWQLTTKGAWQAFQTPAFGRNLGLILVMAVFHYAASAVFAYAAFLLGAVGNTVGYAIFNTSCVVTAIVSGLVVGEWKQASTLARRRLYTGLACMVVGILVIAYGNRLATAASSATAAALTR